MSGENHRVETVFVFGGGASRADGLPSQAEILPAFYELDCDSQGQRETREILTTFLRDFYEVEDPIEQPLPTLEHILGVLEMPARLDVCYPQPFSASALRQVRSAVLRATLLTLEERQRQSGSAVHDEFVRNLQQLRPRLEGIHFISLNYDTVLDHALSGLWPEVALDYGLDFTNFYFSSARAVKWMRPDPGEGCGLLKVHGSLNFKFCPLCQSVELISPDGAVGRNGAGDDEDVPVRGVSDEHAVCPRDGTPTELLMAPPSLFKEFTNPVMLELWRSARRHLLEAKRIVIVGYSLPLADLHIWQMLKNALVAGRVEQLIVIGSPSSEGDDSAPTAYRQLTRDVRYHAVGFEAFARDPAAYLQLEP